MSEAFRQALQDDLERLEAEERDTVFDIRESDPNPKPMNLTTPQRTLAEIYGLTRPSLYRLRRRFDLDTAELANPEKVFEKLLNGRKSPLRTRLTDPENRARIAEQLDILAIRGASPDIATTINSIQ